MKEEEIQISDISRIVFGDTPPIFFLEVIIRISCIYLILMVSMRLMGKRMASSLSRTEQAAMVSLAAAVGMPLQSPDRGLLPAVVIATVVVFMGRLISYFSLKSNSFENLVQDNIGLLVKDSVMQLKTMKYISISRERLYAQLRSEGIKNLGEVKRLYLEANGTFTLIKNNDPSGGLSLIPHWDKELLDQQERHPALISCMNCGYSLSAGKSEKRCPSCDHYQWTDAYLSRS